MNPVNQEQIEQYVSGRMSESDARAFEEYCLANPEFARQVEFEQRLKAGIVQASRGSTEEFVRSNHPMGGWRLAAAASVTFVLFGGFWAWNKLHAPAAREIMAVVAPDDKHEVRTLRLALVRGSQTTPELPHGQWRVEIVGLFDTDHLYSVALDRLDAKRNIDTLATLYGQRPVSPHSLEVLIDSDRLEPGAYSLRIRKQASTEEAVDIEFLRR
jgi:hypothetical protein